MPTSQERLLSKNLLNDYPRFMQGEMAFGDEPMMAFIQNDIEINTASAYGKTRERKYE